MKISCNYSVVIELLKVVNSLLYTTENGQAVERKMPFNLKYKLTVNAEGLAKLSREFEDKRVAVLVEGGATENEETHAYDVPEDKKDELVNKMAELLSEDVKFEGVKIPAKDIEELSDDTIDISSLGILLFRNYLMVKEGK